jgi:hypothetical protein
MLDLYNLTRFFNVPIFIRSILPDFLVVFLTFLLQYLNKKSTKVKIAVPKTSAYFPYFLYRRSAMSIIGKACGSDEHPYPYRKQAVRFLINQVRYAFC